MKKDVVLKTKTDLPATMARTIVLWLCSLVLVGLVIVAVRIRGRMDRCDRAADRVPGALLGHLRLPADSPQ